MSVAAAMAPDDLSICDIGAKAKVQSSKSKAQSLCWSSRFSVSGKQAKA
jgi:hypothetical protein